MEINRRKFLKQISNLIWIGFGFLIFKSSGKNLLNSKKGKIKTYENNFPEGITVLDGLIISKSGDELKIFKSTCTHLGCNVNLSFDQNLVCPCHGSKFKSNGKVISGPATKNLEEVQFELERLKNQIIVYV